MLMFAIITLFVDGASCFVVWLLKVITSFITLDRVAV